MERNSKDSTINSLLMTCVMNDVDQKKTFHMLVLVSGEISVAHHHFNVCENLSWQVSKATCSNEGINETINKLSGDIQSQQELGFNTPAMLIFSVLPGNQTDPEVVQLVQPVVASQAITYTSRYNPLQFHLDGQNYSVSATFQLWENDEKIEEVVSCFDQYEVSYDHNKSTQFFIHITVELKPYNSSPTTGCSQNFSVIDKRCSISLMLATLTKIMKIQSPISQKLVGVFKRTST